MKFFLLVDEWILDKHQRFADWMTKKTGIGRFNFKLSKVCLTIFIVGSIISFVLKKSIDTETVIFASLVLACGFWYDWDIQKAQRDEILSKDGVRGNSLREELESMRIAASIFVVIGSCIMVVLGDIESLEDLVSTVILLFAMISFVSYLYFISCSSLPPKTKKKEEKLPADLVLEGGTE